MIFVVFRISSRAAGHLYQEIGRPGEAGASGKAVGPHPGSSERISHRYGRDIAIPGCSRRSHRGLARAASRSCRRRQVRPSMI